MCRVSAVATCWHVCPGPEAPAQCLIRCQRADDVRVDRRFHDDGERVLAVAPAGRLGLYRRVGKGEDSLGGGRGRFRAAAVYSRRPWLFPAAAVDLGRPRSIPGGTCRKRAIWSMAFVISGWLGFLIIRNTEGGRVHMRRTSVSALRALITKLSEGV